MRKIKFAEAIRETHEQLMLRDRKIITMGLGINDPMGIFGTTKNLSKKFGNKRVIEIPTSEFVCMVDVRLPLLSVVVVPPLIFQFHDT